MKPELRHCAEGTRRPRLNADPLLLLRIALVLFIGAAPIAAAQTCSVAVDVGHTAASPGATSARGVPEFHFNLALSRALQVSLAAKGCRAMLINEDGAVATLRDRTQQAGDAALFVSIHHDSVQPHYLETWEFDGAERRYSDRFSGYSLFVSRDNPFPGKSLRCASAIGAALHADGYRPSYYHAESIAGEGRPFADRVNGVHFYDQLVVLHTARQPAILIEAGVIVNREAEQMLGMPQTRDRIAQAIADGIAACLASATHTQ